ncbi:MAG: IgA peptidase M64-domain-containing protein [Benniella sp.]|nr:MAG: IgA peptidase M64-domain-containing protein [Benniella sp.]
MRTCLVLSSALALLATALAAIGAFSYGNQEDRVTGLFLLVERAPSIHGDHCTILDHGSTKAFRELYPINKHGDRSQVVLRMSHEHHHGASFLLDEMATDVPKELFELNSNDMQSWAADKDAFLKRLCDHVDDSMGGEEESCGLSHLDKESEQEDFGMGFEESGQDVFRMPVPRQQRAKDDRPDEVRKLVDSGPDRNRVTIVFMGDGYTLEERTKFFEDIQRLVNDMFIGDTFQAYLPLFNVYALFRPSKESGIGVGGRWKDTSFRLYRDGTELRGIYCANKHAARNACRAIGPYACDFPSLIGNDPYYGGLGGEFVISTSSNKSGTIVLRHELGHSLINIGEEYDGGDVYSGVNAERWSIHNIKWKHWLTDPEPREEKNVLRAQDYPWYDLKKGPYKVNFRSNGQFKRWSLKISHSGVDMDDSFEVYLDGKRLNWTSPGGYDRDFSEWEGNEGFSAGKHEIEFRQGAKYDNEPEDSSRPIRQLCSVTMHEFMGEDLYRFNSTVISAYPTFDRFNRKTWRSNHEYCLMRNMASTEFCSVCKEGLWLRLLSKASLLDSIDVECQRSRVFESEMGHKHHHKDHKNHKKVLTSFGVEAKVIPLGQFREDPSKRTEGEELTARWFRDGVHQAKLDGQFKIKVKVHDEGVWEFQTELKTSQVRKDPRGLLKASKVFVLAKHLCSDPL